MYLIIWNHIKYLCMMFNQIFNNLYTLCVLSSVNYWCHNVIYSCYIQFTINRLSPVYLSVSYGIYIQLSRKMFSINYVLFFVLEVFSTSTNTHQAPRNIRFTHARLYVQYLFNVLMLQHLYVGIECCVWSSLSEVFQWYELVY